MAAAITHADYLLLQKQMRRNPDLSPDTIPPNDIRADLPVPANPLTGEGATRFVQVDFRAVAKKDNSLLYAGKCPRCKTHSIYFVGEIVPSRGLFRQWPLIPSMCDHCEELLDILAGEEPEPLPSLLDEFRKPRKASSKDRPMNKPVTEGERQAKLVKFKTILADLESRAESESNVTERNLIKGRMQYRKEAIRELESLGPIGSD